jgi:hypothetical protein
VIVERPVYLVAFKMLSFVRALVFLLVVVVAQTVLVAGQGTWQVVQKNAGIAAMQTAP